MVETTFSKSHIREKYDTARRCAKTRHQFDSGAEKKNHGTKTPCVLNPVEFCQRAEKRHRKNIKIQRFSQTDLQSALGNRFFHPVQYIEKAKTRPIRAFRNPKRVRLPLAG